MGNTLEDPKFKEFTAGSQEWFSGMRIAAGDPRMCTYFEDFFSYDAGDWTVTTTEAGAGSATEAIKADERCGALLLTNDDADNDLDSLQLTGDMFSLTAGKKLWFESKFQISDADASDAFIGLCITDTTPLATTDRIGFEKLGTSVDLDFVAEKDSTETTTDTETDMADATYVTVGFYYDGAGTVEYYIDRAKKGSVTTNLPNDENLAVTMHIQNAAAAAKTMTVDYIFVAQER